MRVIVAGTRFLCDPQTTFDAINEAIASGWSITEVVSGDAPGPDRHGARWAEEHGVPVQRMPGRWDVNTKTGGHIRNVDMAVYVKTGGAEGPGGLILVWTGDPKNSPGSAHMKKIAKNFNIQIHEKIVQR